MLLSAPAAAARICCSNEEMLLSAPAIAARICRSNEDPAWRPWVEHEAEASQQGQCMLSSMFRAKSSHMNM